MNELGPAQAGSSTSPRPQRDAYAAAGAAMRESIERVLADDGAKLTRQTRVLLAVLSLTASYSRVADRVYVAQIAAVARIPGDMNERHTRRELRNLHELGALIWEPTAGREKASWVSLPAPEKTRPLLAIVSEKTRPSVDGKPGHLRPENPATGGRPTEKTVREGLTEQSTVVPASFDEGGTVEAPGASSEADFALAALVNEIRDADAKTLHTLRKNFAGKLPTAAFRTALEALQEARAKAGGIASEARYVYGTLRRMVEEGQYASENGSGYDEHGPVYPRLTEPA